MKTRTFIAAGLAVHARTIATTRNLIFRRGWLWTGFLAFATIALGPQPAQAAVTEAWVQRYSNVAISTTDQAVKVVRDTAGDIIVTGTTAGGFPGADMLTIKYSGANGSVLWQQRYNSPANGEDRPTALAVDGSGNVFVTGFANSYSGYAYTAKYAAADGVLLWEQRYIGYWSDNGKISALAVDGSGNVVVTGRSGSDHYYTAKYAAANGALLWEKRYGQATAAVAVDGGGNVVVTGYSSGANLDYYTAKYAAADGALLWERRYNGPVNWNDRPSALAVDGSGNVVVTGSSTGGAPNYPDYYTAKYAAADGALLWEKRYNGPANDRDGARAVAVDGSGNVVVTGNSRGTNNNDDFYTAKYAAADGALLWEQRHNGPANVWDFASAVTVDDSGNVVVTGRTCNGLFGLGPIGSHYYTAKYAAADGVLLWERRYDNPANGWDSANAVTVDASGNVVVTGHSWNGTNDDYYTAKYAAADGAPLWEQRYDGSAPSDASAREVAVDGSGNVAVTGVAFNYHPNGSLADGDYYTAKYAAADGALLWERRYNGPANSYDQASAVAVDGHGNVVVTGSSGSDIYTAKYAAADGALLWEKRYSSGQANAVAVDGSGNVVVTGSSAGNSEYFDLYTAKYAATDGALLWEKRYNGPANGYEQAQALAIDASGNVVVTGSAFSWRGPADYYTAKYAATDGALLWEKRYSSGQARAVAVDGSGNVVVTGSATGNNTIYDYYTAKYAAADGALLWERGYNGPANSHDQAYAVAVDGNGNVVVTGRSGNGTNDDYYTAKYAAANGALLWEKRYNGPANSGDFAKAVVVDGSGNVVVTGDSGGYDYHTAKYAAADGALLWEKRFNGPGSVGDSPHCLALGPDGMVVVTGSANGGYATVACREVLPPVSIDLIPASVRLRFTGVPGRSYNIERSPALTDPWSTIHTQITPASGLLEYLDTLPHPGSGFYRIVQP